MPSITRHILAPREPRTVFVCGWCVDEGRPEPEVGPEDEVNYGTCRRHRARAWKALRRPTIERGK